LLELEKVLPARNELTPMADDDAPFQTYELQNIAPQQDRYSSRQQQFASAMETDDDGSQAVRCQTQ
jgi:hypothetical protein